MLTPPDYIYYTIYIVCMVCSFRAREAFIPGLRWLRLLLCFGLLTEAVVELLQYRKQDDTPPYYFYIPFEYYSLTRFYKANTSVAALTKALEVSVPVYVAAAGLLSFYHYRFTGYPSVVYNISCFLNTVWISLLLFYFDPSNGKEIWRQPLFIVLSAFLIFFAGVFFFNPAYAYVQNKDPKLAITLRTYVNTGLNYILYILLSYGFLCSAKTTK